MGVALGVAESGDCAPAWAAPPEWQPAHAKTPDRAIDSEKHMSAAFIRDASNEDPYCQGHNPEPGNQNASKKLLDDRNMPIHHRLARN